MKQNCMSLTLTQAIEGMAFRANLLALHAAIELAGETHNGAGRELAAEEIRCVAKRRARAADGDPQGETRTS
jgi:methyl-accepting chemotaxis protein